MVCTDKSVKVIVSSVVMHHCAVPDWLLFFHLIGTGVLRSSFILGFGGLRFDLLDGCFDCRSQLLGQLIRLRGRSLDKLGDEGESGDLRQLAFE